MSNAVLQTVRPVVTEAEDRNLIREQLAKHDRSYAWLARRVQKSRSTVKRYGDNAVQPDIFTLKKIAQALACKMEDLVS